MTTAATISAIPAAAVVAGDNDRKSFERGALEALAASIAADGLAQPITVRQIGHNLEGPTFEIVAGERRFRACTDVLGWTEVPAIVRDLTDAEASRIMLTENLNRVDLDPVEEARAYAERLAAGMSLDDLSAAAGKGKGQITWQVKILDAAPEVLDLVANGHLSTDRAWHLARLDANRQRLALRALAGRHLPMTEFRTIIDRMVMEAEQEGMFDADTFMRVEEWVGDAADKAASRKTRRQLVDLLEQVADVDLPPHLAAAVRDALAAEPKESK
jgi:ParB family transcriptional regulator, chromosome partitioning protein